MSVEQHEIELKELLARVMRDPLQPLQAQLDQTGANLTQMDQQLKALRDVELGGVCARLDVVEKSLKRLRSWSEDDAPSEFKNAVLPPVQQALNTLGTRIDTQFSAITQPVAGMSYEIAQTASAVERLAEQSAQSSALAGQRVASLGQQVRDLTTLQVEQSHFTQSKVKGAIDEAVEHLNAKTALANAKHEANLKRLVDEEVSRRIDKLMILGRWAVGIGIAALCAATAGLYLYIRGLP